MLSFFSLEQPGQARASVCNGLHLLVNPVLASLGLQSLLLFLLRPRLTATQGINKDQRLQFSDGSWHRSQRNRVSFETACYFSHEPDLPYGCQYSTSESDAWKDSVARQRERVALVAFYDALEGFNWRYNDNWKEGDPCWDFWYGITCDEHGRVIYLELTDNRLKGRLGNRFGDLTELLKLDLSSTGDVYMGYPNLYMNRIEGPIPSLKKMKQLTELVVDGNLIGALPADLYENQNLRVLSAARNRLRAFPARLNRFANLHTLELSRNQISQQFPNDHCRWLRNLRIFQVDYNDIRGPINGEVIHMTNLEIFDISHNPRLDGELPEDLIVDWQFVEYISITNTSLTGYMSSLCFDVPFCEKFMYDTHKDLTWATAADVPDIVNSTMELALTATQSPARRLHTAKR